MEERVANNDKTIERDLYREGKSCNRERGRERNAWTKRLVESGRVRVRWERDEERE